MIDEAVEEDARDFAAIMDELLGIFDDSEEDSNDLVFNV